MSYYWWMARVLGPLVSMIVLVVMDQLLRAAPMEVYMFGMIVTGVLIVAILVVSYEEGDQR